MMFFYNCIAVHLIIICYFLESFFGFLYSSCGGLVTWFIGFIYLAFYYRSLECPVFDNGVNFLDLNKKNLFP